MLFFLLWPDRGGHASYAEGLRGAAAPSGGVRGDPRAGDAGRRHLPACPGAARRGLARTFRCSATPTTGGRRSSPHWTGRRWTRKAHGHASGVAWAEATRTDALLVNLRKTERDFSPTTMYRDYALSPELFHWESQNATTLASAVGQRYVHHRSRARTSRCSSARRRATTSGTARRSSCLGLVRPRGTPWRAAHRHHLAATSADAGGDVPGSAGGRSLNGVRSATPPEFDGATMRSGQWKSTLLG